MDQKSKTLALVVAITAMLMVALVAGIVFSGRKSPTPGENAIPTPLANSGVVAESAWPHLVKAQSGLKKASDALGKADVKNHGGFVQKARASVKRSLDDMNEAVAYLTNHPEAAALPDSANETSSVHPHDPPAYSIKADGSNGSPNLEHALTALNEALVHMMQPVGSDHPIAASIDGLRDKILADIDETSQHIISAYDFGHNASNTAAAATNADTNGQGATLPASDTVKTPAAASVPVTPGKAVADLPELADPLLWSPGKPGPIDVTLAEDAYRKQRATILGLIDKSLLEDKTLPLAGLKVVQVGAGSRAQDNRIQVDDIITALDGQSAPLGNQLSAATRSGKDFRLSIRSKAGGTRELSFTTGALGVGTTSWMALDRIYWRLGQRDARWDDDMLLAANQYDKDPVLALAALKHAQDAGCKDPLWEDIRALAAAMGDRYVEALEVGLPIVGTAPAEVRPLLTQLLEFAAVAMYHPHVAVALQKDFPVLDDDYLQMVQHEIELHKALPDAVRISRSPAAEAPIHSSRDYSNKLEAITILDEKQRTMPASISQGQRALSLNAPAGMFQNFNFGPVMKDFVYSTQVVLGAADPTPTEWGKVFMMQLFDYDPATRNIARVIRVDVLPSGKIRVGQDSPCPEITTNYVWFADRKKHQLSVAVIGQRMRVKVDNNAIYDALVTAPRDGRRIIGAFGVSGLKADISALTWRELLPMNP